METIEIAVKPRFLAGSDVAKKVRRAGLLPAVLYGHGVVAQAVAVDPKPVKRGLQGVFGRNQLFRLNVGADSHLAIAREVQLHPLTRTLVHVDFFIVTPTSLIDVTVPVRVSGRSLGQKAGGRLEIIRRHVRIRCTPETLPSAVEIDITLLTSGSAVSIETLPLPPGVTPVFKRAFKILEIVTPKAEEAVAAPEEAKTK